MTARPVAVVAGGSAGVGRAVVQELAAHGYDVAVLARGKAGVDAAVARACGHGARSMGVIVDVADPGAVRSAAARVDSELGPIAVWVNVAFVGALRYFWDTDPEVYQRITEVAYLGTVNGTRAALDLMRPRDHGVIVQIGSALGYRGIPLQSAYCGAKHAINGFTESVLTELKHDDSKVRLCTVTLPAMNTPQFDWNDNGFDKHPMPVPPIFQPELAARAVRFVAEHPRRNIWVGYSTAGTIIGNRLMPALLDWYLGRAGVKSQLTSQPAPRLGSNVFEPRDDEVDQGAHGAFDERSAQRDPWSWLSMRRRMLGAGIAASIALSTTWRWSARS